MTPTEFHKTTLQALRELRDSYKQQLYLYRAFRDPKGAQFYLDIIPKIAKAIKKIKGKT